MQLQLYKYYMGFWANVESELEYQGITRKELAQRAKISYAGIGLGIERDSMPGADTALRVSKVLDVSIEYLLLGSQDARQPSPAPQAAGRYRGLIADIERLPAAVREPICDMIHRISAGMPDASGTP